jgi:hypothetical protein
MMLSLVFCYCRICSLIFLDSRARFFMCVSDYCRYSPVWWWRDLSLLSVALRSLMRASMAMLMVCVSGEVLGAV